jgi:hypothetical protein
VLAGGTGRSVAGLALFEGRESADAMAYLCRSYACDVPTGEPAVLGAQLDELLPKSGV